MGRGSRVPVVLCLSVAALAQTIRNTGFIYAWNISFPASSFLCHSFCRAGRSLISRSCRGPGPHPEPHQHRSLFQPHGCDSRFGPSPRAPGHRSWPSRRRHSTAGNVAALHPQRRAAGRNQPVARRPAGPRLAALPPVAYAAAVRRPVRPQQLRHSQSHRLAHRPGVHRHRSRQWRRLHYLQRLRRPGPDRLCHQHPLSRAQRRDALRQRHQHQRPQRVCRRGWRRLRAARLPPEAARPHQLRQAELHLLGLGQSLHRARRRLHHLRHEPAAQFHLAARRQRDHRRHRPGGHQPLRCKYLPRGLRAERQSANSAGGSLSGLWRLRPRHSHLV